MPRTFRPAAAAMAAALASVIATSAVASTSVGGPILTDTTWSAAGSPYLVTSSVLIGGDSTLLIEPGVEVRIGAGLGITIGSAGFGPGTLVARGTAIQPIVFTSDLQDSMVPAAGDWNAITFGDQAVDASFTAPGSAYVSGSVLEHCVVEYAGGGGTGSGAIVLSACTPWIADVIVRDSAATGIRASLTGSPALRIERSELLRCAGVAAGGGLHLVGGTGHRIIDTDFRDCSGSSGGGAFIDATTVEVRNGVFEDNSAASGGGGLYFDVESGLVIDCAMTGNSASSGGGVQLQVASNTRMADCTITGNSTAGGGGGLYVNGGTAVVIENCTVDMNTSSGTGGGGFFSTTNPEVTGCSFSDNQSINGEGGGAYLNIPGGTFSDNDVVKNSASSNGGGLRLVSSNGTLAANRIDGNVAGTGRGGGAYVSGNTNAFSGGSISGNTAGSQGGGLDVTGSSVSVTTCRIADNEALVRGGGLFWSGTGGSIAGTETAYNIVAANAAPVGSGVYHAAPSGQDLAAQRVCWGVVDAGAISDLIHDFFDDSALGIVLFFPFIDDPDCAGDPCPEDLDDSGVVDFGDLLTILAAWGPSAGGDVTGDGVTDFDDLLAALAAWGPCP
jgi:parallel beta-helix repeat protein